jgi:D-alanyl-D-alanine carboxypeptidase/D-alanyl-D-alanine-endopeptidase (penicillin-binding protein 4)
MLNVFQVIVFLLILCPVSAQNVTALLGKSVNQLQSDAQMKHAMIGLYVADSKTGKPVFERNARTGLAPASSQKVITSAAAFELLGRDFRFQTTVGYSGAINNGELAGDIIIKGTGDPTLGSWRWDDTREDRILQLCINEIKKAGIRSARGGLVLENNQWSTASIPDGWIWQDIGNYYGTGSSSLNWRENQYDLALRSGNKTGDTCRIISAKPVLYNVTLACEVTTAAKGSGDNAYIYLPPYASAGFVRGTIPRGESSFTISGAFPNSGRQFMFTLENQVKSAGIDITVPFRESGHGTQVRQTPFFTHVSPSLDSINYWFMKKSINLYGEALFKAIALKQDGFASTQKAIEIVKYFWSQRGIEKPSLQIFDGCGLSPQNRVTAQSLVQVLLYARSRPWFGSFYNALPEINGISMKSGSIEGTRSYTGYIKSKSGNEYSFAIIVNNYYGSPAEIVRKMWSVLDILK